MAWVFPVWTLGSLFDTWGLGPKQMLVWNISTDSPSALFIKEMEHLIPSCVLSWNCQQSNGTQKALPTVKPEGRGVKCPLANPRRLEVFPAKLCLYEPVCGKEDLCKAPVKLGQEGNPDPSVPISAGLEVRKLRESSTPCNPVETRVSNSPAMLGECLGGETMCAVLSR